MELVFSMSNHRRQRLMIFDADSFLCSTAPQVFLRPDRRFAGRRAQTRSRSAGTPTGAACANASRPDLDHGEHGGTLSAIGTRIGVQIVMRELLIITMIADRAMGPSPAWAETRRRSAGREPATSAKAGLGRAARASCPAYSA